MHNESVQFVHGREIALNKIIVENMSLKLYICTAGCRTPQYSLANKYAYKNMTDDQR